MFGVHGFGRTQSNAATQMYLMVWYIDLLFETLNPDTNSRYKVTFAVSDLGFESSVCFALSPQDLQLNGLFGLGSYWPH